MHFDASHCFAVFTLARVAEEKYTVVCGEVCCFRQSQDIMQRFRNNLM